MNSDYKMLIIGAGPSGVSTWLFLNKLYPKIAAQTLVIEKSTFPRNKLCGGGISTPGISILETLEISKEFSYQAINQFNVKLAEDEEYLVAAPENFIIVDRYEFDNALCREACDRGMNIVEDEEFISMEQRGDSIRVTTSKDIYVAKCLIGADGAKSNVRRFMKKSVPSRICRLLESYDFSEVQGPVDTAYFDFSEAINGTLQGYLWRFPMIKSGKKMHNFGVYDSNIDNQRGASLKHLLQTKFPASDPENIQAHPIRYATISSEFSENCILLVGDAAGVDPALGEGISISLSYGKVAAETINTAFENEDFTFSNYPSNLMQSGLGFSFIRQMHWAKAFYSEPDPKQALKKYFGI